MPIDFATLGANLLYFYNSWIISSNIITLPQAPQPSLSLVELRQRLNYLLDYLISEGYKLKKFNIFIKKKNTIMGVLLMIT